MADVYALLIGINAYPDKPLPGTLNDVAAMADYLERKYPPGSGVGLHLKKLTDETQELPVRNNIISAFSLFSGAKGDDICLFYFSGHGSRSAAPEEFWTEGDGMSESFVCLDSRAPGGRDLMNKEMGYLLWKTFHDKPGVRCIVITDCCHSGTITKGVITDRMLPAGGVPVAATEYLGYNEEADGVRGYVLSEDPLTGKRRVTIRQADHIHIAACREQQTAKELPLNGLSQGAFTYSLLQALHETGGRVSYRELVDKVTRRVGNLVPGQTPVLNPNGPAGRRAADGCFLADEVAAAPAAYRVYYERKQGRWCINGGMLHGISKGDEIVIKGIGTSRIIAQPAAHFSVIMPRMELGNGSREYEAAVRPGLSAFEIGLDEALDVDSRSLLVQAYADAGVGALVMSSTGCGRFMIGRNEKGWTLSLPGGEIPLFKPVKVNGMQSAISFLHQADKFGAWMRLLELYNPGTAITDAHYELKLYRRDGAGFNPVTPIAEVNDFRYGEQDGVLSGTAFRLQLINKSGAALYMYALYMGFDFSIQPAFEELTIMPGREGWLSWVEKGLPTDVIKLKVDKKYRDSGFTEITEYLKLFIAPARLDVTGLQQEGLERVAKGMTQLPAGDWKTATIGLRIIRG